MDPKKSTMEKKGEALDLAAGALDTEEPAAAEEFDSLWTPNDGETLVAFTETLRNAPQATQTTKGNWQMLAVLCDKLSAIDLRLEELADVLEKR